MEVIKIPWKHVAACLFSRPGCMERCQDAALSLSHLRVDSVSGGEPGVGSEDTSE